MLDRIKQFFGGKEGDKAYAALTDLSLMAVDIHSHLIPGIDDGVKTMEESLGLLEQFEALGFKKIITSPHVVSDGYNNSTETILAGRDKVREAMKARGIGLSFDAVAEYYLDESVYQKIEKNDLLTLGDKKFVLVELSYLSKANNVHDLIYKLQIAGYRVILAHPERYPYYYDKNFDSYNSLKDRSVYFQINLMSLTGKYGKGAKTAAEHMIDENLVDFVGTDLHNAKHMESLKQGLHEKYLYKILNYDKLLNKTLL